jgi:hypothetical protein
MNKIKQKRGRVGLELETTGRIKGKSWVAGYYESRWCNQSEHVLFYVTSLVVTDRKASFRHVLTSFVITSKTAK